MAYTGPKRHADRFFGRISLALNRNNRKTIEDNETNKYPTREDPGYKMPEWRQKRGVHAWEMMRSSIGSASFIRVARTRLVSFARVASSPTNTGLFRVKMVARHPGGMDFQSPEKPSRPDA